MTLLAVIFESPNLRKPVISPLRRIHWLLFKKEVLRGQDIQEEVWLTTDTNGTPEVLVM